MTVSTAFKAFKSSAASVLWKSTGKLQQTVSSCLERRGKGLHSGEVTTVKIWPGLAGEGRYFDFESNIIPASIDLAEESPLCTTLSKNGYRVRTIEHLLSALEATAVDNCRIQIISSATENLSVEVPILDGSAKEWVEAIQQVGLKVAVDHGGSSTEKMAPFLNEPVYLQKDDSFIAAFPSPKVHLTYGINFPQAHSIGDQWFSLASYNESSYMAQIASSRTFCIYEELEMMQNAGLIKGGSLENAIVCSTSGGWLNPPLRFDDEPCRHKILDLVGDLSLFARCGSQGLPVAHIVAYKGGHALHTNFLRQCLLGG